ncbi:EAL domain-containing protein [Xanthobacter sp. TB0139]|uniref:EAL domain-containing protein n=1 Tax=Xanthobacter sp. TB0139 TaxID=3459178 RepID=UPI004039EB9D
MSRTEGQGRADAADMPPDMESIVGQALPPALEQAVEAAVLIDTNNRIIFFNAAAERLWGYTRAEVLGRNVRCLLPDHLQGSHDANIAANRAGGENRIVGRRRELMAARKDGSFAWVELSLSHVVIGGASYYLAFLRDIGAELLQRDDNRILSLVVDTIEQAVLILDRHHCVARVNPAFTEMFGFPAEAIVGRQPSDVLASPQTDAEAVKHMRQRSWQGQASSADFMCHNARGEDLRVIASTRPLRGEDGEVSHIVLVLTDITERWRIETLQGGLAEAMASGLSLSEVMDVFCRRLENIAPYVVSSVMAADEDMRLRLVATPSLPETYSSALNGLALSSHVNASVFAGPVWAGEQMVSTDIVGDPRWNGFRELVAPLGFRASWACPIMRRDGRVTGAFLFYFREYCSPPLFLRQVVDACEHLCAVAFEREAGRKEMDRLAQYDPLTSLPNRMQVYRRIDGYIADAPDECFAVFVLDLDHFKDLNDTRGHSCGDTLLFQVARRLELLTEDHGVVGRIDGDTFVLVRKGCRIQEASVVAEALLRELRKPFHIEGDPFSITASIGIAEYPQNGPGSEALVKSADLAMHRSKVSGPGQYMFFSPEMNALAAERLMLGARLHNVVEQNQLALHYQPQIWTERGELCGVEALLRWTDPSLGPISPEKFIPLAEETGEIVAIGRWCLRQACQQMASWRDSGMIVPTMAVNVSAHEFRLPDLPDYIASLLSEFSLPPVCLTLEITETAMMGVDASTFETVGKVRNLGVGLSMDDFGTGYASLASLSRLPVTELKIDRSFMSDIERDAGTRSLTMAVVRIGQSLGLSVVAEGVETDEQADILASLGCETLQGFLFAQPMPPDELKRWMRTYRPRPRIVH